MDYRDPDWVAERLGLDRNTVYKFLQEGTIPAVQLGRKWLVSEKRLMEWLEQETDRQTQARREAVGASERTVRRMESFAADAREIIRKAHSAARAYNHSCLGQEHLLLAMSGDGGVVAGRVLQELGLAGDEVRRAVELRSPAGDTVPPRRLGRDEQTKRAMRLAEERARSRGEGSLVDSADLLMGIALCGEGAGFEILQERGVSAERMKNVIEKDSGTKGVDDGRE